MGLFMTTIPYVCFNSAGTQFALEGDSSKIFYSFQAQIKWWQRLSNVTIAKIFSSLETRERILL